MEMILKRLTKTQKGEILEAYQAGVNTNLLAEKYGCTTNTINRTVKTFLSDSEYKLLKEKRSKISNIKEKQFNNKISKEEKVESAQINFLITTEENVNEEDKQRKNDNYDSTKINKLTPLDIADTDDIYVDKSSKSQNTKTNDVGKNDQGFNDNFEEIAPLNSCFDFNFEKQKSDFQILDYESLPEMVYMIVDKKVELDSQLISDLPEWDFLPENELNRNAILLYSNQRSAKRSCSKNQRVIKIPNTSVFEISKSYLAAKGVTRLIFEDSIIALDN